jgi:3-oxoacyl-[acyl-carrier-protein] synthase-3
MKSSPRRSDKPRRTVSIVGTGSYVPERILTNQELEKLVDTTDEWIRTRTGISERRIARKEETTSDMATKAALAAMEQAKIAADEIDLIIVATVTPDTLFPATACWVQKKLGAFNAACFDVSAACSGFIYAMEIAQQFISTHVYNTVLIIGADKLSSITDWTDRNTCVLFGDGAGAAVLRNRANSHGVITTYMGSDGEYGDILHMPGGGSRCPITDRMGLPLEKFYVNLQKYGNTSAAAVAIALDEAHRTGRFKVGDYILLVVFGGGLTWASSVIQW